MDRKRITVFVLKPGTYLERESLTAFIDGLIAARDEIPPEHQAAAVIEFESEWESMQVGMEIFYDRAPTEEEVEAEQLSEKAALAEAAQRQEAYDRSMLVHLKALYEPEAK